jgi:hypothetical protein
MPRKAKKAKKLGTKYGRNGRGYTVYVRATGSHYIVVKGKRVTVTGTGSAISPRKPRRKTRKSSPAKKTTKKKSSKKTIKVLGSTPYGGRTHTIYQSRKGQKFILKNGKRKYMTATGFVSKRPE